MISSATVRRVLVVSCIAMGLIVAVQAYIVRHAWKLQHFGSKGVSRSEIYALYGTSFFLLCFIGLVGYLLYYIYQQKLYGEIQRDLVKNITHEFRTPLSAISLSAEVLKAPDILNNPARLYNYAKIISDQSLQLTDQVDRVLKSTIARNGAQVMPERFTWQEVIYEATELYHDEVIAKGGALHLHLAEPLIYVTADRKDVCDMLAIILDNALSYTRGTPVVHVYLKKMNGRVLITIEDNGIGIQKKYRTLIFEQFFRVPKGDQHNVKGFGTGLHFARIVARQNHGEIFCRSKEAKGSIFIVSFPQNKISRWQRLKQRSY